MADPRIRNIKIKTGVVKRIAKEKTMYEQEIVQQSAKVEKMKVDGKDEHDVKKQLEVLQESKIMVPDAVRRLKIAHADLSQLLENEKDLSKADEYTIAQKTLEDTTSFM